MSRLPLVTFALALSACGPTDPYEACSGYYDASLACFEEAQAAGYEAYFPYDYTYCDNYTDIEEDLQASTARRFNCLAAPFKSANCSKAGAIDEAQSRGAECLNL